MLCNLILDYMSSPYSHIAYSKRSGVFVVAIFVYSVQFSKSFEKSSKISGFNFGFWLAEGV